MLIGRGSEFVRRIAAIFGTDKGQYFPKIVGVLDDGAERRHGTDDVFSALAHITLFLKFVGAQRDEPKQGVVIAAVDPRSAIFASISDFDDSLDLDTDAKRKGRHANRGTRVATCFVENRYE